MVAHFQDGLSLDGFLEAYAAALEEHRPLLVRRLRDLLLRNDFSSPVTDIELGVFPDETGDGHVSVWCYLQGPNRRVSRSEPTLFAGKSIQLTDGMRVPLHEPDAYGFSTADASTNAVMQWAESCWREAGGERYRLPAVITGHESCCGSGEMRPLNPAAAVRLAPRRGGRKGSGASI